MKPKPKWTHDAVPVLRRLVREYESDTFSASGAKLTVDELDQIVATLINGIEDDLDGMRLSAILDDIRGKYPLTSRMDGCDD